MRIEHYQGEQLLDSYVDDALWGLMYFGKARPSLGWLPRIQLVGEGGRHEAAALSLIG